MSNCISSQGEYADHDFEDGVCASCGHIDVTEVRASAIEKAAEVFGAGEWAAAFLLGGVEDDVTAVQATERWFKNHAKLIREES